MSTPRIYHDIPSPSSTAAGRNNKAGNAQKQAKLYKPAGADPNEPDLATMSRFAHRVIDRATGESYSADELQAKITALRAAGERVVVELPGHVNTQHESDCDRQLVLDGSNWIVH